MYGIYPPIADSLKFPPHILDIQQVLSDKAKKCTVTFCRTKQFLSENPTDPTVFRNSAIAAQEIVNRV